MGPQAASNTRPSYLKHERLASLLINSTSASITISTKFSLRCIFYSFACAVASIAGNNYCLTKPQLLILLIATVTWRLNHIAPGFLERTKALTP
jgi:hypothetical protein